MKSVNKIIQYLLQVLITILALSYLQMGWIFGKEVLYTPPCWRIEINLQWVRNAGRFVMKMKLRSIYGIIK